MTEPRTKARRRFQYAGGDDGIRDWPLFLDEGGRLVEVPRRLKEGAIVVCGPTGMSEADIKSALVDALFALKNEPDRPRIYLVVDAEYARVGEPTHG